jgi:hypothetical protein
MGASRDVETTMHFERVRARRFALRAAVAFASASTWLAGGCGSSGGPPPPPAAAQAVCPATPGETVGAACSADGLVCGPQYPCGNTLVPLYCVCMQGAFACRDGLGHSLAHGDTPSCPGALTTPPACPATEFAANLNPCSSPGQICAYPSACPNVFDACTCSAGETASGGFGTVYVCEPAVCLTDAAPPPLVDASLDAEAAAPEAAPADAPAEASEAASGD